MNDLNAKLQPIAEQVLRGDYLNCPTLHKFEMDRVLMYCIAVLREQIYEMKLAKPRNGLLTFGKSKDD